MASRQPYPLDHATHVPILIGLGLNLKVRRVLELGSGDNSTPLFLDRRVFPEVTEVVSFEDSPEWMERMKAKIEDSRAKFVDAIPEDIYLFDLILVDNAECTRRVAAIERILKNINDNIEVLHDPIVVVHDTENPPYTEALKSFPCVHRFESYDPATSVAWVLEPGPRGKIRTVADFVQLKADSIPANDVEGWIAAFKEMAKGGGRKTVSIMMTAYDRAHLLKNTLDSILIQTRKPEQIVIVEDGYDGGKTETLCNAYRRSLPIEYFCRRKRPNVGFSNPAIPKNIGIRKCTGEILIIQGAEVKYTNPNDIENLVAPVEKDPYVSMFATCKALDQYGKFDRWYGDPAFDAYLGFCHAVRLDKVIAIGGFDELYRGYGYEDNDFMWRLHVSGITCKWALDVLTYHQWHPGHPDPNDAANEAFNREYGGIVINDYHKKRIRGLESNIGIDWGNENS